jgi:septum formation protein
VLASTSPFRRAVLGRLGLPFTTFAPEVDEDRQPGENAIALVRRLAEAKARRAAAAFPDALVIGSDQVAVLGERILTKPGDHARAVEQLRASSGQTVTFHTGLCLLNTATAHVQVDNVPFTVVFRTLTDPQIESYLRRERPYNSAGSFKSEALGIALFERVVGDDPTALIGLPLIRLTAMLAAEGVDVMTAA